jgi:uncharacterized membrane protein YqjE
MSATRPSGLGASLGALGCTVAGILHTRVELLAVEGAQLQRRLGRLMLLAALGLLALALGAQGLATLVIACFWDTPFRLGAIALVAASFALAAAGCLLAMVRTTRAGPPVLDGTLRSLAADLEVFR